MFLEEKKSGEVRQKNPQPTHEQFLLWVVDKTGPYNYVDNKHCPWAEFLISIGYKNVRVGSTTWVGTRNKHRYRECHIPKITHDALLARDLESTYEKLRDRLGLDKNPKPQGKGNPMTTYRNPVAKLINDAGDIVQRDGIVSGVFFASYSNQVCIRGALMRAFGIADADMVDHFWGTWEQRQKSLGELTIMADPMIKLADQALFAHLKISDPESIRFCKSIADWSNNQSDKQVVAQLCWDTARKIEEASRILAEVD